MQLGTRARYAVMAMVELARREAERPGCCRPVCLSDIAASQNLSLAYLEQLFVRLRREGLVCSMRGPGGGYRLKRAACAISIADTVAAVGEPVGAIRRGSDNLGYMFHNSESEAEPSPTRDLWIELGRHIHLFLENVRLADVLAARVRGRALTPTASFATTPVPAAAVE